MYDSNASGPATVREDHAIDHPFERLPAPLIEVADRVVVRLNAAARRLLGYEARTGPLALEAIFIAPADALAATAEEPPRLVEARTADGRALRLEVRVEPLPEGGRAIVALHDVTAREQRERGLQSLADNIPDVIARFDDRLRHKFVNEAVVTATGLPPEQWLGRTHREIGLPAEFCAMWEQALGRVFASGAAGDLAFDFPGPDGVRYFQVRLAPELDDGGAVCSVLAIARDVTGLKRAEDALAAANVELVRQRALAETMINAFPGAIAYCGPDMVHRAANDEAARRYGLRHASELVGRRARDFFPEAEAHVAPLAERAMRTGEPYASYGDALVINTPNGREVRYRDFLLAPVAAENGGGFVVVAMDATKRVELEQLVREQLDALRRADRYKDEFLSVISHELRTPLNFITGFASILADGVAGPLSEQQAAAAAKILAGADRMLALVDDLLDVAKLSSGQFEVVTAPVRYHAVVDEALAAMTPVAERAEVALLADVPELPPVALDGGRIGQVLLNLLSNAIKFTEAGGQVVVAVAMRDGALHTEVRDTGCGIAPEDQARLFQRFVQLDMSSTRARGGTGLGLAICKAIVDAHGGEIGVESEPGRGSTFWFRLPLT